MLLLYTVVLLTAAIGSGISVICGFGLGIFAMMFLPYLMSSTKAAAATVSLISLVQAGIICARMHSKTQWKDMFRAIIWFFAVSALCLFAVKDFNDGTLKIMLGSVMILLSLYFLFLSGNIRMKPNAKNGFIAGCLGGFMSALFGIGGPPASLYFSSAYDDKEVYLATIQSYFLLTNIYMATMRIVNHIITKEVLICAAVGIAGMLLGTWTGKKIFDRMNADAMRKSIYVLMGVSGAIMILESSGIM